MTNKRNRFRPDRQERKRRLFRTLRQIFFVVFAVAGTLGLSAVFTHSYHALLEAPWPCIEEIRIEGLNRLERRRVLNALAVPRKANILSLRMRELDRRLEALAWVRSAVVRLDMPGRLVVEIEERAPLAIVYADGFYLVDTEGALFLKARVKDYPDLLLVTDFSDFDLGKGDSVPVDALESLTELLSSLKKARQWLPLSQISECHWEREKGFVLYTLGQAMPIRLGARNFDVKLKRLYRVFGLLSERQWWEAVTRIDLDYSDRVYLEGDFPTPKGI